jgi:D-alanyl-D-alanine carboxypeptidase
LRLLLIAGINAPTVCNGGVASGAHGPAVVLYGAQRTRPADARADLVGRLDTIVRDAVAREPLAGVSVAVLRGQDMLLQRGYGYADLGLKAPATEQTTYRLPGPAIAAAIMQQVERGRLRLDDDAARLLPEFPWQGRRVTVRQLMDATSGLQDFHYLGDPQRSRRSVPKAQDEVTALFAGRPFTHEPGERYQWTISGLHLAGILLERVAAQPYPDYLREQTAHVFGLGASGRAAPALFQ